MKKIVLTVVCVYLFNPIFAQETTERKKFETDTTYIKSLSDKLILKLFSDTNADSYTIQQKEDTYKIAPNYTSKVSFGVVYKNIMLNISIPQDWIPYKKDDASKGTTENFVFNFGFFFRKWYQYFNYSNTKGYYLTNTSDYDDTWQEGDPHTIFPELTHKKYESFTYYIFNAERFSYRSFLHQIEIQKKSAGSLIPVLNCSYLVRDDYEFTDSGKWSKYGAEIYSFSAMIGYQYNWVPHKNFNVSAGGFFGAGARITKFSTESDNEKMYKSLLITYTGNLNLNYQHKNLFCGTKLVINGNYSKEQANSSVTFTSTFAVLYIGYRFNSPKLLDNCSDKIFGKK